MESRYFEFTSFSFDNDDNHFSIHRPNEIENDMNYASSIEDSMVSYKYLIENDLL